MAAEDLLSSASSVVVSSTLCSGSSTSALYSFVTVCVYAGACMNTLVFANGRVSNGLFIVYL